eukprot:5195979-Amphidinium_carterae.1
MTTQTQHNYMKLQHTYKQPAQAIATVLFHGSWHRLHATSVQAVPTSLWGEPLLLADSKSLEGTLCSCCLALGTKGRARSNSHTVRTAPARAD